MIHPGLCSISFRPLSPAEIVDLAARAGLRRIEWGSDVHVPAGDVAAAQQVRELTQQGGLEVASYGSYLRCVGPAEQVREDAAALLRSASALGAPRIRLWAGERASAETSAEERRTVVERLREVAQRAADEGMELGLEWHGGTLTDEISSTLHLLEEVGHPALRTYWQPHQSQPAEQALADLRRALDQVTTVHVFSWWPGATRLRLAERADLWSRALATLAADDRDHDALLEFVPGDDPALLAEEAATLLQLIEQAQDR